MGTRRVERAGAGLGTVEALGIGSQESLELVTLSLMCLTSEHPSGVLRRKHSFKPYIQLSNTSLRHW